MAWNDLSGMFGGVRSPSKPKKKSAKKKAKKKAKKAKKKRSARKKAKQAVKKTTAKKKAVGKAPTSRRTRAVPLREVREAFTWNELDCMGKRARAALSEVRAGSGQPWYELGVSDVVSYRIQGHDDALRDFLWRIGEPEVQSNPPTLHWLARGNVLYYNPKHLCA